MSHPFEDQFGYPLKSVQALRWLRNKRKPIYVNGEVYAPEIDELLAKKRERNSKIISDAIKGVIQDKKP